MSDYVELHAHSAYSFLDGASQPDELLQAAAELGYGALAVTDHDNLCGAMEFAMAASASPVRGITGAELSVEAPDGQVRHVTVLARTREGYANLCALITHAHAPRGVAADVARRALRTRGAAPKPPRERVPGRPPSQSVRVRGSAARPDPLVSVEVLCEHAAGLTLLTGCASRGLLVDAARSGRPSGAVQLIGRLQAAFGCAHVYVELQLPQQRGDAAHLRALRALAEAAGAPVVATGNVHAHTRERGRLHEALVAISRNTTLEACEGERDGNLARVLRSPEAMARRFVDHPDAVRNTRVIAESIEFDLAGDTGYRYPSMTEDDPRGRSADEVLAGIATAELERRYAGRPSLDEARARLAHELGLIRMHGLSGFFLLHRDVLELAREVALEVRGPESARQLNPPGRGRGSSVESIVCYLTGLSHVDPIEARLRGGRFLNEAMPTMPDIDLDFARDIRHGLLARVVERYGERRCAMVAAHGTFKARGAIRDVGKALGLPQAELARIAAHTDSWGASGVADATSAKLTGPRWQAFRSLVREIDGLPRGMGQHSGGVVISTDPLDLVVPIQPAAMRDRQLVQWDKDSCSDAGFLKIDVLGLGMLSAVEECVETIVRTEGRALDLSRIPLDDRAVYAEIEAGDTVGTFQIESRAQIQSLRRVRPQNLDDLVVQVALIRPGPIIGQSVNPYVEIRERLREDPDTPIPYDHPLLEPVLKDTLGAIVFQDQVIEVSMALAGFTAGEADGLRRAMTRKRAAGSVELWRPEFLAGARERGVDEEIANRVFDKVIGFCHYGFPRAHSVAFALLAYQSSWLRHHWPAHFHAAVINAEPMGFYPPDSLLRDAERHGVAALPIHINVSDALCTVEQLPAREAAARMFGRRRAEQLAHPAIRIGMGCVKGVGYADALAVQREREQGGDFSGIDDLLRRAPLRTAQLEELVMAGACDSFGPRRELLWQVGAVARPVGGQGVLDELAPASPEFPQLSMWDEVLLDFSTQGLSVRAHPVELLRPLLPDAVVTVKHILEEAKHGTVLDVVAAVTARQRPGTAKGVVFLLLEDETGQLNAIVGPELYKTQRTTIRGEPIVRVRGRVERHGRVVNLVAREVHRLPSGLRGRSPKAMRSKSWG